MMHAGWVGTHASSTDALPCSAKSEYCNRELGLIILSLTRLFIVATLVQDCITVCASSLR